MKPSLLFVDDETRVLDAIRRCVRTHREVWDISFAMSGEAALEHLRERRVDAIVTDMRMPEMDGVELLRRVCRSHPATMRVVLSGQTEFDAALACTALAHQLLGKPCTPSVVMDVVNAMHGTVSEFDDRVRGALVRFSTLPSSPIALEALDRALGTDDVQRISDVIASDAAMSAKILQVTRSSFFGGATRNSSVEDAVRLIGTHAVRTLRKHAFGCETWRAVPEMPERAPLSMRVGALARAVADGLEAIPVERLGDALFRLWGIKS